MECNDLGQARIRPGQLRQALHGIGAGHFEQVATATDQARVAPARKRLALVDGQAQRIRPLLAGLDALDPGQARNGVAHILQLHGEKTLAQMCFHGGADLFGADVRILGAQLDLAHWPARGGEPAVQHADDGQGDQGQGDAPGKQARDQGTFHGSPPATVAASRARLDSRIRQHKVSNSMPTARAAFGTSEWLVMPGVVLTSSR